MTSLVPRRRCAFYVVIGVERDNEEFRSDRGDFVRLQRTEMIDDTPRNGVPGQDSPSPHAIELSCVFLVIRPSSSRSYANPNSGFAPTVAA
jgi:hypothetical protein